MIKIKILILFLIFSEFSFSQITPERIKKDLLGKTIEYSSKEEWKFENLKIFNLRILEIENQSNNGSKEKLVSLEFQAVKEKNSKLFSGIEGELKLLYSSELVFKGISFFKNIEFRDFPKSDFVDLLAKDELWNNFYNDFISGRKEKVTAYFSYPISVYSSTIDNKNTLLNRYNGLFSKLNKMITKYHFLSFPKSRNGSYYNMGDYVVTLTVYNPNNEENEYITLVMRAKKFFGKLLFYSLEYSS